MKLRLENRLMVEAYALRDASDREPSIAKSFLNRVVLGYRKGRMARSVTEAMEKEEKGTIQPEEADAVHSALHIIPPPERYDVTNGSYLLPGENVGYFLAGGFPARKRLRHYADAADAKAGKYF